MAATPEERLAAVARQLVDRMVEQRAHGADPLMNLPDYADFAEELRPYVQRELLMVRMGEAARFGTYKHVQDLQKDIEQLEAEIDARGKKAKR